MIDYNKQITKDNVEEVFEQMKKAQEIKSKQVDKLYSRSINLREGTPTKTRIIKSIYYFIVFLFFLFIFFKYSDLITLYNSLF